VIDVAMGDFISLVRCYGLQNFMKVLVDISCLYIMSSIIFIRVFSEVFCLPGRVKWEDDPRNR